MQFALNLFDAGQVGSEWVGERFDELVFGDAHRLAFIAQGVFGNHLVFAFSQQQANGGVVEIMLHLPVYRRHVKSQLRKVLRLELAALEFNHDITAQLQVVEQQIDEKLVAADIQQNLPPDKKQSLPLIPAGIR